MNHPFSPGDFPANPPEKPGYRLEFHDEFSGQDLDQTNWLPYYLPQWSSRERAAANYHLQDGSLVLQIEADQQPWCPEFDGQNRCSCLQTGLFAGPIGSPVGQSRFNSACVVRESQDIVRLYTPRYGYFETRVKGVNTPTDHVSLWMIGYEDSPEKSAEIAVMEIMGQYVTPTSSRINYGVHPWFDPSIVEEFYEESIPIDATHFHIYAAEWAPTHIDFYVDNRKLRTINQSPQYDLQIMLGMFELPQKGGQNSAHQRAASSYPKRFTIDYVRAYQPVGGYPQD